MSDRLDIDLDRRQLIGLGGLGLMGGLAWDVFRDVSDVSVTAPAERPDASDEDLAAYVQSCTEFGLNLLSELADADAHGNVLLSPLGLSAALAMTWAGARGETQRRMRETLHFPYGQDRLHPAVGALQYDLAQHERIQHREVPEIWNDNNFELGLTNALWGQQDYPFASSFRETLSSNYGTELQSIDFDVEAEVARQRINRWAKLASNGHVSELVPPGAIDQYTVYVLTTAVYLRADWQQPFDPDDTEPGQFTRPDGSTVEVPMMQQEGEFPLLWVRDDDAEQDVGYRAVELPYVGGDVSMVLAVPSRDHSLADLEAVVDAAWLEARFTDLDEQEAHETMVTMPRFTFGNDLELTDQLEALGMTTAFDPGRADFSGVTDPPSAADSLHLAWVFHNTHVAVDEKGTVAVAVTGVGSEETSAPPSITLDRPFLCCIRDRNTDAVLFLGRVVDPSDT